MEKISEGKGKGIIHRVTNGFLESNMYVIEEANHILVIDPNDSVELFEKSRAADSVTVLITHEHFDHICGLNKLRKMATCKVIASKRCSERMIDAKTNLSLYAEILADLAEKHIPSTWKPFYCDGADVTFIDEFSFDWMGCLVKLISTPGHSYGSCCILIDDMFFSGDTILENINITSFPGGSKKLFRDKTLPVLNEILPQIKSVYPGHGNVMTSEEAMKAINNMKKRL